MNTKRGFTLIELLVVISIISLLSTVVISQTREARLRAENAQITSDMRQWMTALERYKIDTGKYYGEEDSAGGDEWTTYYTCLGFPCIGQGQHNPSFQSAIEKYIQYKNPNRKALGSYGGGSNTAYISNENSSGSNVITLVYFLNGNSTCLPNYLKNFLSSTNSTRCENWFFVKNWQ